MDIILGLKELAAIGVTPPAAVVLYILFKINASLSGYDKRIALVELTVGRLEKAWLSTKASIEKPENVYSSVTWTNYY